MNKFSHFQDVIINFFSNYFELNVCEMFVCVHLVVGFLVVFSAQNLLSKYCVISPM